MTAKRKSKARRRGRGEGTIWFDKTAKRWRGQISRGTDEHRVVVNFRANTKGALLDKMAVGRTQQSEGTLPAPSATTVAMYVDHWTATARASGLAGSTCDIYEKNFRLHVKPSIGSIRLQKLKSTDVEKAMNEITGLRLRLMVLTALSGAIEDARDKSVVSSNPCDKVKRPRPEDAEIHPLNAGQLKTFQKSIVGHEFECLFVLAAGTGARQGELMAAKWTDFDLKAGTWSICRTITVSGGVVGVRPPKTKRGRRKITLDAKSIAALIGHRKAAMASGRAGKPWVFCQPDGSFIDRNILIRRFAKAIKDAGLPSIRFHDLRHTHATLLLAASKDVKYVSHRLGHASIAITLDIYAHVIPDTENDAMDRYDRLFG